jgi:hypothetical protein
MTTFEGLLEQHAGVVFERQRKLAALLGERNWQVDIPSGRIRFEGEGLEPIECEIQLLGSESFESHTWLWAWANKQSNLPLKLLRSALEVQEFGTMQRVDLLTEPSFVLEHHSAHEVSMVACGICHADAYYRGDYGAGALYCALRFPQVREQPAITALELTMLMSQLVAGVRVNHKRTFLHYVRLKSLHPVEDGETVTVPFPDGARVNASFDDLGRLTEIRSS